MTMSYQLGDLGVIRGGRATASRSSSRGDRRLALHAGDLSESGSVDWSALHSVAQTDADERHLIREGDVLIPLRSIRVTALVARKVPPGTIAAGHWAIITTSRHVLPEYLVWYLTHPSRTSDLKNLQQGTNLSFISITALKELEVEVPPLDVQERIIRIQELDRRRKEVEQKISQARQRYINEITQAALERAASPQP